LINIESATDELHIAFKCMNSTFFDNVLPEPAITIQSSGKRSMMGWCSRKPIWHNAEGSIHMYEINIAAEYLNIEFYETMNTMLHEMVHLYNKIVKVQDVSRAGQYHNKRFKNECLRRGFYYDSDKPDKRLGFVFAKITDETKRKIDQFDINRDVFVIARNINAMPDSEDENKEDEEKPKRKSHIRKITCPSCGNSVRASKEVNIRCDDCNEKMIEEEIEE
jgi:ribosomal protein S27E